LSASTLRCTAACGGTESRTTHWYTAIRSAARTGRSSFSSGREQNALKVRSIERWRRTVP